MSKTALQLLTAAQTLTEDDNITSANGLIWTNEFLTEKLGVDAMIKLTRDYPNSVAHESYDLPTDFDRTHKVDEYSTSAMTSTVDRLDDRYFDYEIDEEYIIFYTDGNYKLHYFVLPTEITTINDAVNIDPVFYSPCKLYLGYRQLTFGDEDNAAPNTLGQLRLQEFYAALNKSIAERKKKFKLKHKIRRV
jgi:hypothetical protein